jgi:hypothetical protein
MTPDQSTELIVVRLAMQLMMLAWITLVVLIVRRTISRGSVGLPAALVMTMSFLYGGSFVYAIPGYTHLRPDGHWTLKAYSFTEPMIVHATFVSLLAILGFAIGCGVLRPTGNRQTINVTHMPSASGYSQSVLVALSLIGLSSFTIHYLGVRFPMSHAVIEAGRNMAVVAISLGAVISFRKGISLSPWVAIASLIPMYYVVAWGFTSYGFLFSAILGAFWIAQLRKQRTSSNWIAGFLWSFSIVYVLLNAFIGWFSFRDEVRKIVWRGSEGSLVELAGRAFAEIEMLTPWNFHSLDLINIRLNLNIFISRMIEHHYTHPQLQQFGATLIELPLALVPRFLWPGKPSRGGNDFMEEHTGMFFSDSTSMGTGMVFEFFINFRYLGVFVGFMLLGWLISRLDRRCALYLSSGKYWHFARLYLVGIIAIDPLLRPFFMVTGAVVAWFLVTTIMMVWPRQNSTRVELT